MAETFTKYRQKTNNNKPNGIGMKELASFPESFSRTQDTEMKNQNIGGVYLLIIDLNDRFILFRTLKMFLTEYSIYLTYLGLHIGRKSFPFAIINNIFRKSMCCC